MVQSQVGFVLKRFQPSKSKINVLSMNAGKFDLSFKNSKECCKLWPGMLVSFLVDNTERVTFGHDSKILVHPHIETAQAIYFMHHILELCFFFVPDGKPCSEVFNLLKQVFVFLDDDLFPEKYLIIAQKIFVIKLLSLFGFFAYEPISKYLAIHDVLTTTFVDFSIGQKVEFLEKHLSQVQEIDLDEWICASINFHPNSKLLKTIPFIYKQ